ncbi:MogA/MoaB family molybdenum cofactor biosynthesis protein [bacterium]|nr:MogA/MoaB family molybdenum cofactor biosynthesis protein [bacterium]MCI0604164.1 MogA/MoaB family molybdenum cofactor biosynthesis protein [bacterium]
MKYAAAVITVSDSCYRKESEDRSGPALIEALQSFGIQVEFTEIVPDDHSTIVSVLRKCIQRPDLHLIMTTGGTGFSPRDVTPEATREVIERPAPGIAEILRQAGAAQTFLSWLSRGEAGTAGNKLLINLPGSTKAMAHSVEVLKPLLFHALDLLNGAKPH